MPSPLPRLALLLCLPATVGQAANINFGGAAGDWGVGASWAGGNVPVAGDNALVANGGGAAIATVSSGSFGNYNDLIVGGNQYGFNNNGIVNHTGGQLSWTSWMKVGHNGRVGTYNLSGGTLSSSNRMLVGAHEGAPGTGFFTQSGGTVAVANVLVGRGTGSFGTYNISNGVITGSRIFAGVVNSTAGGTGVINQTGGSVIMTGDPGIGANFDGSGAGATGFYNLSGGTFQGVTTRVGHVNGSQGTLTLSGNGRLITTASLNVGDNSGIGRVNVNGGTGTFANSTFGGFSGSAANAAGTLNMTDGVLNFGWLRAGFQRSTNGWLNQSGGTINVTGNNGGVGIALGTDLSNAGAVPAGTMLLSNGAVLNATQSTTFSLGVGDNGGTGYLQVDGANTQVNLASRLAVGRAGGAQGTVVINNGSVSATALRAGDSASAPNSVGTLVVNGGSLTFTSTTDGAMVGVNGTNSGFIQVNGGVMNAQGTMILGNTANAAGTVTVNGGQARASVMQARTVNSRILLDGGEFYVNNLQLSDASRFDWGSATLGIYTPVGSVGTTDASHPLGSSQGPVVRSGARLNVANYSGFAASNGSLTTGSGTSGGNSTLDLGGLYLNNGVRFNDLALSGSLDLSAGGDTLRAIDSPYLLRPFGFFTQDAGTLPLINATGGIIGTFDTFISPIDDSRGFSMAGAPIIGGPLIDPLTDLAVNTWQLQYTATGLFFHYRVAGSVPEPGTFGLVVLGTGLLRLVRRARR
jgi:hypothetical protein